MKSMFSPKTDRTLRQYIGRSLLALLIVGTVVSCGGSGGDSVATATATSEPVPLNEQSRAAARLLTRASFGPSDTALREVLSFDNHAAWIDAQIALPASLQLPYTQENSNGSNGRARHEIWWTNAIEGPDQLRQRVAFALSEIFVVSDLDFTLSNSQFGMASYYDMLATRAFGTYRELLEAVTLHPVMGIYLSMLRNEKADPTRNVRPDENYAREVLQLFSIGLHQLDRGARPVPLNDPAPAYTQENVEEYARVFTGWNFANTDQWVSTNLLPFDKLNPMEPVEFYHDTGAKVLLNGTVVPANGSARADLELALDSIADHPNVAPFFSRRLIERLVTSNPSPGYVARVAAVFDDDGSGLRGNLGAVVKAILLDSEAQSEGNGAFDFGKLDEPVMRLANVMRALDARPGAQANGVYHGATRTADRVGEVYGQSVMRSASVFNFFQPDSRAATGGIGPDGLPWVAPERQIMTEAFVASINNDMHQLVYEHHSRANATDDTVVLGIEKPLALLTSGTEDWVDWLELVVLGGHMSPALRQTLTEYMEERMEPVDAQSPSPSINPELALTLVLDTLYLTTASPDHLVQ